MCRWKSTKVSLATLLTFAVAWAFGAAPSSAAKDPDSVCSSLSRGLSAADDIGPAITSCLSVTAPGGVVDLAPGVYYLRTPLTIDRRATIRSKGVNGADPTCKASGDPRCATIIIQTPPLTARLPIDVSAAGVELSHLIIRGEINAPNRIELCRDKKFRPSGGGIRVLGEGFRLVGSVLRDMACYTALEATQSAKRSAFERNQFGPNGRHDKSTSWADGLTIHESADARVLNNLFIDNTDVQLILGGCLRCKIEGNVFRHTAAITSAAFAEIMLNAWPSTSGDFTGTRIVGNHIDCGPGRGCGYGIQVGTSPWKPGRPVQGATIVENTVTNAMVGINVDGVSGLTRIENNSVNNSGGRHAACGNRVWMPINVSPQARPYVSGDLATAGGQDSTGCLLNFPLK